MKRLNLIAYIVFALASINGTKTMAQQKDLTWEELRKDYKFPKWYTESKLGIWICYGPQSQPLLGGGWYARHMYQQNVGKETWGRNAYGYHLKTYGHPSEIGMKDVAHQWKADKLNTDSLLSYFKNIGAKFFVIMANHHDHFDNFASTYHPWNSVNVGPKKDIVGLFEKSSRKYGLPFGVSTHDDRFLNWWLTAFGADTSGAKKGVKYDGWMTKADGKGKWWDGLDPADLYGLPPEKRTPEWIKSVKETYVKRHEELVSKYNVDMLWFDGFGFPYNDYGKEVCKYYFNQSLKKNGKVTGVIAGKFDKEPSTVKDIERGGSTKILYEPWQGTMTFTDWFYKEDKPIRHSARTVIENLTDIISKNGNLMLNVELYGDGRLPAMHKIILDTLGMWMNRNAEAIYASKAWKIFGDNVNGVSSAKNKDNAELTGKKQEEDFNERTLNSAPYADNEVRFTVKGKNLYVFVLNPKNGKIEIPSLGYKTNYNTKKITAIAVLGSKSKIKFAQKEDKLVLPINTDSRFRYTQVYKISGIL